MEKQRGVEVFILREGGESAKPRRYTRRGHAKPNGARRRPERERAYIIIRNLLLETNTNVPD